MTQDTSTRPRLQWLDAAKAWGMFLVFYGHFVEKLSQMTDYQAAATQQKLIYAFHMPLFIIIAGCLARTEFAAPGPFLRRAVASRIVPAAFLCLIAMPWHLLEASLGDASDTPTELRARWVRNWKDYASRLTPSDSTHHRSRAAVYNALPDSTQQSLLAAAKGDSISTAQGEAIMAAVNDLFDRRDLFDPQRDFADIGPPAVDKVLRGRSLADLSGDDMRRYNIRHYWKALWPEWNQGSGGIWGMIEEAVVAFVVHGWTNFNIPVWFLVGLFSVELIHYLAGRFLVASVSRAALGIVVFAIAGWFATQDVELFTGDIWFGREAVLLYSFYLLGFVLRGTRFVDWFAGNRRWILFLIPGAVLLGTFQLNPGARDFIPMVLINLSRHGDPLWFAVGAIAGSLAVFGLSALTPAWRVVNFTGRHTLIFMGMNGFFFSFFNEWIVELVAPPQTHLPLFLWCTLVTLLSLAASAPFVHTLDRWLPQLVGRPLERGPLLPPLA